MKLKAYKDILSMTKETIDKVLASSRTNRAKKQAELEVAKLKEEIATKETKVHELCTEKDLHFANIIAAQDSVALADRRLKQMIKLISEMFP